MAKLKENVEGILCAKCDKEMRLVSIPQYEFEEGLPLHHVQGYKCQTCAQLFFTEEQAKEMEMRTDELKEYAFGFQRKVTISGRSLVVGIPAELAEHIHLKPGTPVKILPISNDGFLVRKV
ncbi:hypothetical protein HYX14_05655 [Candidatus Woesearchaeota archaeon]|nr:hypothetical protein [Candidatus Woesearchaeota archaeon]